MKRILLACMIFAVIFFTGAAAIANANNVVIVKDLIAGQHEDVGNVSVWKDGNFLYVKFKTDPGWLLAETHLHVSSSANSIPQTKKGNPIPGKFDYQTEHAPPAVSFVYQIPLSGAGPIFIAAHASVKGLSEACIDFEDYVEKEEVDSVSTAVGNVNFYMVNSNPLAGLAIGDIANLTPTGDLPVVATPDTSPPYGNIVAFTYGSSLRDDIVIDENGTGAGGNVLTDPQDTSQIELLWHAYSQFLAIVIDASQVENLVAMGLASIDLDHNEIWTFQFFDKDNTLLHAAQVGPIAGQSGDGKAFPVSYFNSDVAKIAAFGGNNLQIAERIGYAIDNVCMTVLDREETAWGEGIEFPGNNWATYFTID